jgi:membrane-bound metal-dependent hydrolase YbcI (DUF457 family)
MYAISHAATALALKRRFPTVLLWPLLISAQAIELLWVAFVYAGVERVDYRRDTVHLGFLPYSHSIGSTTLLALLVWAYVRYGRRNPTVAVAVAIGVLSHVMLDIIHHEPDIALLPIAGSPRIGFGLATKPVVDLAVELVYGLTCWFLFRGSRALFAVIVAFNLMDIPLMFPQPGSIALLARHPAILPTVILSQIVLTWTGVWYFARLPMVRTIRGA